MTTGEVPHCILLVSATDANAPSFYTYHGLEPLPGDPLRLFLLVKDMRRLLRPLKGPARREHAALELREQAPMIGHPHHRLSSINVTGPSLTSSTSM